MKITEETRRSLRIASNMEELLEFCLTAEAGGGKEKRTGYPVRLIPFGDTAEEEAARIEDQEELFRKGPEMLRRGAFGYVHVIKIWK